MNGTLPNCCVVLKNDFYLSCVFAQPFAQGWHLTDTQDMTEHERGLVHRNSRVC